MGAPVRRLHDEINDLARGGPRQAKLNASIEVAVQIDLTEEPAVAVTATEADPPRQGDARRNSRNQAPAAPARLPDRVAQVSVPTARGTKGIEARLLLAKGAALLAAPAYLRVWRDGEYVDGIGNVLQHRLSEIYEFGLDSPSDQLPDVRRNAYAAWPRKALDPRYEVHSMAIDVFGFDDDITETDGHAQIDTVDLHHASIAHLHGLLHFQSATHGIDGAAEFNESAITRAFDDSAVIFTNFRLDDDFSAVLKACVGALLVGVHQTRIADNIHAKDCRKATFNTETISLGPRPGRAQILLNRPECEPSNRYESAASQQSGGEGSS
jgi:hypothetical protein